jgi:hypothetical protein
MMLSRRADCAAEALNPLFGCVQRFLKISLLSELPTISLPMLLEVALLLLVLEAGHWLSQLDRGKTRTHELYSSGE